ncbi:MAG: RAMP superfamily CRISPR-associated protein [Planctomycetia bacterium]|nr:RAMP superfamily CRISPR-associated protein [Planctomycetia bacterium]
MSDFNNEIRDRKMIVIKLTVEFPNGFCVGVGSVGNQIRILRAGNGSFLLPGTSIAGVLRSAFRSWNSQFDCFFGSAPSEKREDQKRPSPLQVEDVLIDPKKEITSNRVSHLRCRHAGSVVDSGLYSVESAPAKTSSVFYLRLNTSDPTLDASLIDPFLKQLAAFFQDGLVFGGNGNRGIGLAQLKDNHPLQIKEYDLTQPKEYACWLNDDYRLRSKSNIEGWQDLKSNSGSADTLTVEWNFEIPSGQDILVSDGKGLDAESEPHRITAADGHDYWLLPGSSLRGLFRNECLRLAAKEGKKIADSLERYEQNGETQGDEIGWLFAKEKKDDEDFLHRIDQKYPLESLFGSLHKKGRLHISDGLSKTENDRKSMEEMAADFTCPVQYRVHVVLDPISGGAIDGALFDNYVLTSGGRIPIQFPIKMIVHHPKEEEVRWLAQTLRSIHLGRLRVGSSKSAGRLSIKKGTLRAHGEYANLFNGICRELNGEWYNPNTASEENVPAADSIADPDPEKRADPPLEGILHVIKKGEKTNYQVTYTNTKGKKEPNKPLYQNKRYFNDNDAVDGDKVCIILEKGQFKEVWIAGKPKTESPKTTGTQVRSGKSNNMPTSTNNLAKAPASILGLPFHNPYTFIPFTKGESPRKAPAPRTIDERETDRFCGVLELELETVSPLMINEGKSKKSENSHKVYSIQTIDQDVIVPATGVRGFLRNLATIATGGPLTVLEEETWLCQGRDLSLPLSHKKEEPLSPVILARIIEPGNSRKEGIIEIGETIYVFARRLEKLWNDSGHNGELPRPGAKGNGTKLWAKVNGETVVSLKGSPDFEHTSEVKLSGRPVKNENKNKNDEDDKREGVFVRPLRRITLPAEYWAAYISRNKHGNHPELRKGELRSGDTDPRFIYCTDPRPLLSLFTIRGSVP